MENENKTEFDYEGNQIEQNPYEYTPISQEPPRKRGSMGLGILVGVLLGLVLMLLLFLGYHASQRDEGGQSGSHGGSGETVQLTTDILTEEWLKKLEEIEAFIDEYYLYEENQQAMRDGMLSGLIAALDDDYAYYYNEEEYAALLESNSGTYYGIGVQVSQDVATYTITVTRVFAGSPALEAGILPGDILTAVGEMSVEGMDLNTVVTYIRGEEGTTVELTFYRPELGEEVTVTAERRKIDSPSVEYEMLEDGIGYILLTEFAENTYDQYMEAIEALKTEGMEGLIVDVRDNPGGLLDSVVDILDEMLPEGRIVTVRDKHGNEEIYDSDRKQAIDIPTVVLINGNSASAAEIYSAALQDYEAATLVGEKTFGKGIVQTIITLSDWKTGVKITTARYYTPNDVCIHEIGVSPDVEETLNEELLTKPIIEYEEDNQLQKAIEVLKDKMNK